MLKITKKADNLEYAYKILDNMKLHVKLDNTNVYDESINAIFNTERNHPIFKENIIIGQLTELVYPTSILIEIDKELYLSI